MHKVFAGESVSDNNRALDVICIGGSNSADISSWKWLQQALNEAGPSTQVWAHDYTLVHAKARGYEPWLMEGHLLLKALKSMPLNNGYRVPIVFVAHSLGGITLKVTLQIALRHSFQELYQVMQGIIFLSTPQPRSKRIRTYDDLNFIVKTFDEPLQKCTVVESEFDAITSACWNFELIPNITCPILTTYETVETPIRWSGRFGIKSKLKKILVSEENGKVHRHNAINVALPGKAHMDTCRLGPEDAPYQELRKWVR